MNTKYITNPKSLISALADFKNNQIKSCVVLCASNSLKEAEKSYINILNESGLVYFGGVFPALIFSSKMYEKGCILIGFDFHIEHQLIPLNASPFQIKEQLSKFKVEPQESSAILSFISSSSRDKSSFLNTLFDRFGNQVNYLGAGCGDLSFGNTACIFSNSDIHHNTAIVAFINKSIEINFTHGWEAQNQTYKVTQVEKNEILSINWKPALEVYLSLIQKITSKKINKNNLERYMKYYPFGIARLDSDYIIRDPYAYTDRGGILVVDQIDEGEHIRLMQGSSNGLINACKSMYTEQEKLLVFDCISRLLFHDEQITQELQAISKHQLTGAFSIGEIANRGNGVLEMYNKIVVTAKF